jgi:hypothetical protein
MTRIRDIANILSSSTSMATDAEVTSAISAQFVAGKNKIINGDFSTWLNGTTFSNPGLGGFIADKWNVWNDGSGATRTYTQQTFTPGTAPVAGYEGKYFVRLNQSVAGTGGTYNEYVYNSYNVRLLAGQTSTISFWAKSSSTSTMPSIVYRQYFGAGVSSPMVNSTVASSIALTNSWTRYSYTFTVPSIAEKTMDETNYIQILFNLPLNATFTIDLWGVQLEAGAVATAFNTATGNYNSEIAAAGSTNFDGVLVSNRSAGSVFGVNNWAGYAVAGKNICINGGFDIWQRGTSIASGTVHGYSADRWVIQRGGWAAGATVSRQAGTGAMQYCARVQRDSGNTNTAGINIQTSFETSNSIPFAGQTMTLSFYARAGANYSGGSNQLGCNVYSGTGTDQNTDATGFTGSTTPITNAVILTTAWQRFTFTGTAPLNCTQLGMMFNYAPTGTAGAADYFDITGIQLEIGSAATQFSRAGGDIQGELAKCQRYYQVLGDNIYELIYGGYMTSGTVGYISFPYPVTMRTTPTGTLVGGWAIYNTGQPIIQSTHPKTISLRVHSSTTGQFYFHSNTTYYLTMNAEL